MGVFTFTNRLSTPLIFLTTTSAPFATFSPFCKLPEIVVETISLSTVTALLK